MIADHPRRNPSRRWAGKNRGAVRADRMGHTRRRSRSSDSAPRGSSPIGRRLYEANPITAHPRTAVTRKRGDRARASDILRIAGRGGSRSGPGRCPTRLSSRLRTTARAFRQRCCPVFLSRSSHPNHRGRKPASDWIPRGASSSRSMAAASPPRRSLAGPSSRSGCRSRRRPDVRQRLPSCGLPLPLTASTDQLSTVGRVSQHTRRRRAAGVCEAMGSC